MTQAAWVMCFAMTLLKGVTGCRPSPQEAAERWSYGFVSANATTQVDGRRVRVKVVTQVFAVCGPGDRPSRVLADSDSALRAALEGAYGPGHEITYRYLDSSPTAARARRRRSLTLQSRQYGASLEVPYAWATSGRTCP